MARAIQLFQKVRQMYNLISLNESNHNRIRSFNGRILLLFAFPAQFFICSTAFLLIEAQTTDEYGISFFTFISVLLNTVNTSNTVWKMDQISALIESYEEFIEKRLLRLSHKFYSDFHKFEQWLTIVSSGMKTCPAAISIYVALNQQMEFIFEILYFLCVNLTANGVTLLQISITIINYFAFDLKEQSYYLNFPVMLVLINSWTNCSVEIVTVSIRYFCWRLPFNWRTPIGYAIAVFLQYAATITMLFCTSAVISFWLGSCWLFMEMVKDITNDLAHFNGDASANWNGPTMNMHFVNTIKLYLDAKQLGRYKIVESRQRTNISIYLQIIGQIQWKLSSNHKRILSLGTFR